MYAMILAAGRGKRMLPLTKDRPKALLEVNGKPLIEYQIEKLMQAGIRNFVVNCGHFGEKIENYITENHPQDSTFQISREGENILETGGGILNALPLIHSDPFIVVNADVWTDYNYTKLPKKLKGLAHLVLVENPEHNPEGDFGVKNTLLINESDESYTFSGIGVYKKEFFAHTKPGVFPLAPLFKKLSAKKLISAEIYHGKWRDIGTPERLYRLQNQLAIPAK